MAKTWSDPKSCPPRFLISVDGTYCPIQEPTKGHKYSKNPKYYSHKFKERKGTQKEGQKLEKKWSWQNSWAKEILWVAISNGDITEQHSYDQIHMWHPEVQATS